MLAALIFAPFVLVRRRSSQSWRALLVLAVYAVVFVGVMSVLPKKFDRYALPVFPALDIIAAATLGQIGAWVVWRWSRLPVSRGIAWGEGYEVAGAYLADNYQGCDRPVATWYGPALQPFVCGSVVPLDWAKQPDQAGYAVLYIDQLQRDDAGNATAAVERNAHLIETIRIHGIDYARIYQVLPPVDAVANATFGTDLAFKGYDADVTALRGAGVLTATLRWQPSAVPQNEIVFLHLLTADGIAGAGADVPLAGPYAPVEAWQEGVQTESMEVPLPVAPDLPPGDYWLMIGVYDATGGARLPLAATLPPAYPDDGPNALPLGPIIIPAP